MSLVRMVEKLLMEGLPVLLHFPRSSLNEWICSEGLLHTKEDDILKQSQSFFSIRWLSDSSCSDSGSLTMETAIFVKSHLKKWLLSLPSIWNPVHLVQGSTRWYVLVRASTYLTRYKAVRETSKWYIPVRTNIGNSYGSTYWYVLVCTALYLHSTRW